MAWNFLSYLNFLGYSEIPMFAVLKGGNNWITVSGLMTFPVDCSPFSLIIMKIFLSDKLDSKPSLS